MTRSAGIDAVGFLVIGSIWARIAGCSIWRCTMPSNVSWPKPSWRARANASSRFGPVTPVEPARASVWQEPHLATNCCLPLTTFVPESVSWQPPRTAAAASSTTSAPPLLMERGILTAGPDVRRRARQTVQLAARGRDDRARDAVPRVVLTRGGHDRRPRRGAQIGRRLQPRGQVAGQLADRRAADLEREPGR